MGNDHTMILCILCWTIGVFCVEYVCMVQMAAERKRRIVGGDPILDNANFRNYVIRILDNDPTLGCLNGRLLRLKPDIKPDATSNQLDIVIDALKENWRVEVLYIQNFEKV